MAALQPFTAMRVVSDVKDKVTAISYADAVGSSSSTTILFVGTSKGALHAYQLPSCLAGDRGVSSELCEVEVGKGRVTQIEVVPIIRRVIVLCDGRVTTHPVDNICDGVHSLAVRGVVMFCVNQRGAAGRFGLCVAMKRRLELYKWGGDHYVPEEVSRREFALPDEPRAMSWPGDVFCLGYTREYNLLNSYDGSVKDIPLESDASGLEPFIKFLPTDELLVAVGDVGVYLTPVGDPAPRGTPTWVRRPRGLAFCFPYIISVSNAAEIVVHSFLDSSQRIVQQLVLPGSPLPGAIVDGLYGTVNGHDGRNKVFVSVSATGSVFQLVPLPFEDHIASLVRVKEFDSATRVIEAVCTGEYRDEQLARLWIDAGRTLLLRLDFVEALAYLTRSSVDAREVLTLYPTLHSPSFGFASRYFPVPLLEDVVAGKKSYLDAANASADAAIYGLTAPRLGGDGQGRYIEIDAIAGRVLAADDMAHADVGIAVQQSHEPLAAFLEERRRTADKHDSTLLEAIDTALVKLYVLLSWRVKADEFVQSPNVADLDSCLKFLEEYKWHGTKACMLRGLERAHEALSIWRSVGMGTLLDAVRGGAERAIDATVDYLSVLDDAALVWEYSPWVLRHADAGALSKGMSIFTSGRRARELGPDRVLDHLSAAELRDDNNSKIATYLEYIIHKRNNTVERFHTQLATLYLQNVMAYRRAVAVEDATAPVGSREPPGSEPGPLGRYRSLLLNFLKSSSHYNVASLKTGVADTTLFEEQAVLHGKAGEHREALLVIVKLLVDPDSAEEYCLQYSPTEHIEDDPFMLLLQIYFFPEDEAMRATYRSYGMTLLRRHPTRIDSVRVLELLPSSLSVAELTSYLEAVIRFGTHSARANVVTKNLFKYEHLRVHLELLEAQKGHVDMTDATECADCHHRIGSAVIVRYPNGKIVHHSCYLKRQAEAATAAAAKSPTKVPHTPKRAAGGSQRGTTTVTSGRVNGGGGAGGGGGGSL